MATKNTVATTARLRDMYSTRSEERRVGKECH